MPPPIQSTPPALVHPTGSVLDEAVDVSKLINLYMKVVVYGKNRIGKTSFGCQFPKPLLLIAVEPAPTGGALSVVNIPGVRVLYIRNKPDPDNPTALYGTKRGFQIAEALHARNPYATVVFDGATSYQDIILQEIMKRDNIIEMLEFGMVSDDQYRERSSKCRDALRPFLDLKCHVVVLAQEKDHNPPKDRSQSKLTRSAQIDSYFAADLGSGTVKWLHDSCDYIGHLYQEMEMKPISQMVGTGQNLREQITMVETGRIVRRMRTMPHPNFAAGFRSPNPSAVPEFIPADSPEQLYRDMMQVINGIKLSTQP